ncbi:hypothetical protein COMA1_150002 [Candidatus Nitrospira nitrosa]|uniref:Uncharacterized protein n=1 Tax=Candidatus Nitrospira nitrosa TaxID=1742972 RepID=A0A0S4LFT6_9BACT|nr:hypothetical protein COMA1_150002 [Candidatus Nitrospira nitrosa]
MSASDRQGIAKSIIESTDNFGKSRWTVTRESGGFGEVITHVFSLVPRSHAAYGG